MGFLEALNETSKVKLHEEEEMLAPEAPVVEEPAVEEAPPAEPTVEELAITSLEQAVEAVKGLQAGLTPEKLKQVADALVIFLEAFETEEKAEGETGELPAHDEVAPEEVVEPAVEAKKEAKDTEVEAAKRRDNKNKEDKANKKEADKK